ncbi:MAG: ribosome-associated translation inhibitor RaiA [Deltaproteobacteria bacterium]|nr:ribosome-associated translation inhibitor RaiA [Deltaproteobacteria bacterium]
MDLHFTFRNLEATEALKQHVAKKISKFEKHVTYPMKVRVWLGLEKALHCAEITCYAEHKEIVASAKTKNLYESIDTAVYKIENQLRKYRAMKKGHKSAHMVARPTNLRKLAKDVEAAVPHSDKPKK